MTADRHRCLFLLTVSIVFLSNLHGCSCCRTGTRAECEKARFVPGYNLAGEGFDVILMQRKGAYVIDVKTFMTANDTCTLCENNRFKQVQKLPVSVTDWRQITSCSKHLHGEIHHSVHSLVRRSASSIINNWGLSLSLNTMIQARVGGSHSEIAEFAKIQANMDKATFAIHEITCSYYSYRLVDHPKPSKEFSQSLQRLPAEYNETTESLYSRLIDTYGTHYIRQVQLGGRIQQVSAFRTCLATLAGVSISEMKNCLDIDLKIALGFVPADASFTQKCSDKLRKNMNMGRYQGFMSDKIQVLGGEAQHRHILTYQNPSLAYSNWIGSLNDTPEIVSYAIVPLHHLVSDPAVKDSLRSALRDYIIGNLVLDLHRAERLSQSCPSSPNLDYNCCPLRARYGKLVVVVERASNLNSDYFSQTDCYVKVFYNGHYKETGYILDDNNPRWNTVLTFGTVELGHPLILELWDSDTHYDDLIGRCRGYPEKGYHSYICKLDQSVFHFSCYVSCDPHLTGERCEEYSPGIYGNPYEL
ncbi:perforin 1.5 isoform X2 [Scleropages formosus]|nr:perforin-1-like isoform X2 [Scleropages formosus]